MPAAKKHATTRARRNKASTAATLPAEVEATDVPELPDRPAGWHLMARVWWDAVWSSPMHTEWHFETDIHNVYIAGMHYHDLWMAETALERQKATAAYDKAVAKLGLTPYDRRRLEWSIATATQATRRTTERQTPREKAEPTGKPTTADPRGGLSIVS